MTDKAYTNVTADDWVATDPTPRTAATARDALEAICAAHYNDPDGGMGYTSAGYGTFETACVVCGTSDEYAVEWPCWTWTTANAGLIALAAAEARPNATAATARDARDIKTHEGRAFAAFLVPIATSDVFPYNPVESILAIEDEAIALAAAEAPGRVSALEVQEVLDVIGEHEGNGCCDPKTLEHVAQDIHGRALAVPAPTPSESVARCENCGHEPHDSALGCTFESTAEPDWFCACQHDFRPTPGARDE